ncbi:MULTISPECIES: hypothetical protein [Sphingobacterium]|uniref:Tetratricopeptide repeat protein n=1 Tax=Sphingobacterium tenebrionis TaxID=3111775 RepID=A0ABU8IAH6_9SPHI|nr:MULTISPECIES: hypothetical protein [unclassified Sphingobacterium]QBR12428.1 hypothetical protein E3D81_09755 [Sphingobacterium sp. CZ-2]
MTNNARKIVIAIAVAFLLYAIYAKHYNIAVYIFGGIAYLTWSYFKEGTVYLATQAFHKQDYERTKALLAEIKNPDQLRKGRRNFYEFMMGNIALKEERVDEAEYHFQMASRLPWRKDNEKGMVLINLANINLRKKEYERVTTYLDLAEKLKLTARQVSIIEKIRNEVNKHI